MSTPSRKEVRQFENNMSDEWSKGRRNGDEGREKVRGRGGGKTMRNGICKIIDGVYICERGGNASHLAYFIRTSDREKLEHRPLEKAPMTPSLSLHMSILASRMPITIDMRMASSTATPSSHPMSLDGPFHPSHNCQAAQ
jgi:hypothetical protein